MKKTIAYIKNDNLVEAFASIDEEFLIDEDRNEIILLESRFKRINKDFDQGILDYQAYTLEINKIRSNFLSTIQEINQSLLKSKREKNDLIRESKEILSQLSGAQVESNHNISGKSFDIVCIISSPLMPIFTIGVLCVYNSHPLQKSETSEIITDHLEILEKRKINQLLIISELGIVRKAKGLIDNIKIRHLSIDELGDLAFEPYPLIKDMISIFEESDLSKNYITQHISAPDLNFANENYEYIYYTSPQNSNQRLSW